jgi:hypothetical protein
MGKRKPNPPGRAPKTPSVNAEQENGTVFFYMPQEKPYGVFCEWHTSPFTIPTSSLQWLVDMASPPPPSPSASSSSNTGNGNKDTKGKETLEPVTPVPVKQILATYGNGISFICAEQSYMFYKALYFSDA